MTAGLEETAISYEDLAEIENEFDDVDTEIIRHQVTLTAPLYERRHKIVSQTPNFWPLVLEQAPPDIDQYIQPSDSALLLSSLKSLSVRHFELEDRASGGQTAEPRSVAIRWEFTENDYFEDTVLEKKLWYRRAKDGWCGLVSVPVAIKWKKGKDLTGGLLDLVCKAWEAEQAQSEAGKPKVGMSEEQVTLKKKIDQTGMGGLSFFAWFGFIGRRITAAESAEANAKEKNRRELRKLRMNAESPTLDENDEDDEQDDIDLSLEIFPDGDDLAVAITEDLWPGAIKYFTQAHEQDALSDADFESDDEFDEEEPPELVIGADGDEPPPKKRKS